MRKKTSDQKIFKQDGQWKAEIDVCFTRERAEDPPIAACRHAVLTIKNKDVLGNDNTGYVVYDRLLCRIVNGVFYGSLEGALDAARGYNDFPDSPQDMSPNGRALGLAYPQPLQPDQDEEEEM